MSLSKIWIKITKKRKKVLGELVSSFFTLFLNSFFKHARNKKKWTTKHHISDQGRSQREAGGATAPTKFHFAPPKF